MVLPLPAEECWHVHSCKHQYAQLYYKPIVWVNALFLGIFGAGMLAQLFLGLRYRTWGYMIAMVCGIALEIMGCKFSRIDDHSR